MSIVKQFIKEVDFLNFDKKSYVSSFRRTVRIEMFRSGQLTYTTNFNGMRIPEKSPIPPMFEDAHVPSTSSPKTKDLIGVITPRNFLKMASRGDVREATLDFWLKKYRETDTIRFNDIPYFSVKKGKDEMEYTLDPTTDDLMQVPKESYDIRGHEGRHRSLMMILMGFSDELMPIRITSWKNRFKEEMDDYSTIKLKPENNAPSSRTKTIEIISE